MRDFGLLYVSAMRVRGLDCICVCCKWSFTMWAPGQHQNHNLLSTHMFDLLHLQRIKTKKPSFWSCFYQSCFSHHPFKAQVLERDRSLCLSDSVSSSLSHPLTSSWGFTPYSLLPSYWSNPVVSQPLVFHLPGFVLKVFVSAHQPLEYGSCLGLVNFL